MLEVCTGVQASSTCRYHDSPLHIELFLLCFYNPCHVHFIPNSMQVNLVAIQSKNQMMRMPLDHLAFLHC